MSKRMFKDRDCLQVTIPEQVISREDKKQAEAKKQRAFRRHAVTGQVPEVVEYSGVAGDGDEVVIIEDDDDVNDGEASSNVEIGVASSSSRKLQQPQSEAFRESAGSRRVPYINLPTSSYGKIVMKKYVELQESAGPVVNCQPIKIPVSPC